uniref:Uncharacterized protein n=1 Tax=Pseudomonas sp. R9 TaxID=101164 RepID=Q9RBV4_9PSED|nr:hypothetical protein G [Pseudomonas sp. R9]
MLAKNIAASSTPANTPKARLWVATTTTTVTTMTMLVDNGCFFRLRSESQLKVPMDTMIITATSAAIGICFSQSPRKTTISSRNTPAARDDRRERPPDFTLMID